MKLNRYLALGRAAQGFLTDVTLVLVGVVVQTSAYRNAVVQSGALPPDAYPAEFVFLYGGAFAAAAAACYLPTAFALRDVGARLVDRAVSTSREGTSSGTGDDIQMWLETQDERQRLESALGVAGDLTSRLKTSTVLAAPLISGVVAALFPAHA